MRFFVSVHKLMYTIYLCINYLLCTFTADSPMSFYPDDGSYSYCDKFFWPPMILELCSYAFTTECLDTGVAQVPSTKSCDH